MMKKLFVLCLLAVLVTCVSGCSLFGLDDDGDTYVPVSQVAKNVVIPIDLPESAIASDTLGGMTAIANILAAENAANLGCVINGSTFKPNAYKKYTDKNNVKRILFLVVVNYVTLGSPSGNLQVTIMNGTTTLSTITISNIETTVLSTSYSSTVAPTSTQIAQVVMTSLFGGTNISGLSISTTVNLVGAVFTTNAGGTLTVSSTTGSTFVIQTVTIIQVITPVIPDPIPYVPATSTLLISSVSMVNTDANAVATTTLLTKNTLGTTLANLTPVFMVKFNNTISATPATFTVKVTRVDNGNNIVFSQANTDFSVTKTSSTELQIAITSTTNTLRPNSTYKIEFVSGTINGSTFTWADYYTFKTGAAGVKSYDTAFGTTPTKTVTGGVSYVASTTDSIKLFFDYPLASDIATKLAAGSFKLVGPSSNVTLSYGTLLGTPVFDGSKIITIPLLKKMNVGQHTISYVSGDLRDKDGNAINTSLNTVFTVR